MRPELNQDYVRTILDYDPDTGVFAWTTSRQGVQPGKPAGSVNASGYLQIGIDGRVYAAHRLAFLWMTGRFPAHQVDHLNHIKTDNRWGNLRDVPQGGKFGNGANKPPRKRQNLPQGVTRYGRKFRASIMVQGRRIYLGCFETPDEAHKAYVKAKTDASAAIREALKAARGNATVAN